MGRNEAWLSDKQSKVLEWVKAGCPSSGPEDDSGRRITARALHRRGLITIRGHGASWAASISKAGLAWLEANRNEALRDTQVDALIQRVLAAEGRLELARDDDVEVAHRELVRLSGHSQHRPLGWRLQMRTTGPWQARRHEVILVRHFEDLVEAIPVSVPDHAARFHPSVRSFLSDKDWQAVSKEHVGRAARILQAIVDEAPRRGLDVLSAEQAKNGADQYHARMAGHWRLGLRSPAGVYGIRVQEVSASGGKPVDPIRRYQGRTRPAWRDARQSEFVSTGILELVLEGPGTAYDGDRFRDAKTISVEDKLPRVFRAIEIHRLHVEWRDQELERDEEERRRQWEAAMTEARSRYARHVQWEAFEQRSRDWHAVTRHRDFLAAARRALSAYDGPERESLAAHLDAAEGRLEEIDPIRHLELLLPQIPDPKPDDLKPHLDGWSPNRPESLRW